MKLKTFIKNHREEINVVVKRYYNIKITNDKERHEWILSDEGLYRWAHQEGVNI